MDYMLPVWVLDLVIVFFLLEWACLCLYFSRQQTGLSLASLSFALAPGFFLVLGFRFTVEESISMMSLVCLFLAGVLHALDLYGRHQKAKAQVNSLTTETSS